MTKVRQLPYGELAENGWNVRLVMEEAARCLLCDDAPCSHDCPAGTDPGKFIRSIRFKNFKGAARTIRNNNILGASCAEICPRERLCEKACSRCGIDRPIQIGRLQAFAMDQEKIFKMKTLEAAASNGKKVLCIGAGPSSLSVAAELAKMGCDVTIVDENEKAGGLLRYGITPSRLSDEVIDQDIDAVKSLGVKFEMNKRIEKKDLAGVAIRCRFCRDWIERVEDDSEFGGIGSQGLHDGVGVPQGCAQEWRQDRQIGSRRDHRWWRRRDGLRLDGEANRRRFDLRFVYRDDGNDARLEERARLYGELGRSRDSCVQAGQGQW